MCVWIVCGLCVSSKFVLEHIVGEQFVKDFFILGQFCAFDVF